MLLFFTTSEYEIHTAKAREMNIPIGIKGYF